MKVFISVDMEGCSGIVSRQQTMAPPPQGERAANLYWEARQGMAWDANAAVEGSLEAGATEVVVCEAHNGLDIPWDALHPKAKLVRFDIHTSSLLQYGLEGLDETFDLLFFVGHHTAYGDPKGVISHTLTRPFRDVRINGLLAGDIEIWTALAGVYGVPVGLVTGDDALCHQAQAWLPHIETAVVKYALDTYAARCLPKETTRMRIREAARRATARVSEMEPFCFESPVELEIDLVMPNAAGRVALIPGMERVDGTKVHYVADGYWEAYRTLLAAVWLAMSTNDPVPW
jgi:D-amino peptidase